MVGKNNPNRSKLINFFTDIFLNSVLHPYVHVIINLLQYAIILVIVLQQEIINLNDKNVLQSSLMKAIILLVLVLQLTLISMMGFLMIFQKDKNRQNVFILEYESYFTQIIKKVVAVFLVINRKILGFIVLQVSLWVFSNITQTASIQFIGSILNVILMVPIYLLSGVIFASKIAFSPNFISFGYMVNLQSLLFMYLPLMILIHNFSPSITTIWNILFVLLGLATLYIRPIILYRHNKVGLIGVGLLLGLFIVVSPYRILSMKIEAIKDFIWLVALSLIIAWIIVKYAQKRISSILLSQQKNVFLNKLSSWNRDEIIFYFLVNFQSQSNNVFLFLVQELQALKFKKPAQKQGTQKNIVENQTNNNDKDSILLLQKIIQSLKQVSMKDPSLRKLLNEYIFLKYKSLYNPKLLLQLNLGKKELEQRIQHSQNLSMILAQILLLDEMNFRKCYTFIRIHQNLLSKIQSLTFINKIQVHSLIQIVENNLKLRKNIQKEYSVKAEQFFIFQQKYEQLKNQVVRACQNKIQFWKQNLQTEKDQNKIHKIIRQNYTTYGKIKSLTSEIVHGFKQKGPIILYDLIQSYTTKILNIKMFSSLNPYYSLIKKYKEELDNYKRQGNLSQNSAFKKYSLLQNVGVCLIDIETQEGKILWANQYFWTQFYLKNITQNQQPIKEQKGHFIFDIMIPQLSFRHHNYFKLFAESQKLNICHDFALIYQQGNKIIDKISVEIQIFPSFENGFNVKVFLFKNSQKPSMNEKFTVLLKNDMSLVGYTSNFIKEKAYLTQGQQNQEDRQILSQQLTSNDSFHNFLNERKSGEKDLNEQIQVRIQNFQYSIKIVKIYSLDSDISAKNFFNDQSTLQQNFISAKQIQKCIYVLLFTKKNDGSIKDLDESKSMDKKSTVYQQVFERQSSEIRTNASQFTTLNSNNIQKALVKGLSDQNDEILQNNTGRQRDGMSEIFLKKYKKTMSSKNSRAGCFWIFFTLIIILLLIGTIIANLLIFQNRQNLYEEKKSIIKYFNELITDISQLCIALRQYNYFVYVYGPKDPRIPYLINQLKNEQSQVAFKMNQLSGYMTDKWQALQILKTGNFKFIEQDEYVVIANYMLSSMTFLSQIDPSEMNFSPFFMEYYGQPLSSTQVNFNEAIFNGIYVVLTNLSAARQIFLPTILKDITSIQFQTYIYPCFIGIFILLLFIFVSVCIEKKSQNLRTETVVLLNQVPQIVIKQKIDILEEFKQKNCFILANHLSSSLNNKTLEIGKISLKILSSQKKSLPKLPSKVLNIPQQTILANSKVTDTQNQTKRDLVDMEEIYYIEETQKQTQNPKKVKFSQNNLILENTQNTKLRFKLPVTKMQKCRIIFYLFVIGPCLAYFLIMLLGGFTIDSYMEMSLRMESQIHNKKSNQELTYLLTRELFYIPKMELFDRFDWKQTITDQVSESLEHDRKLVSLISQNENAVNLKQFMGKISNGNICDLLVRFSPSPYYDVTFSKEECEGLQSKLLMQGLKPSQNWYMETSIEIVNSVPEPQTYTIPQRYEYLKMQKLKMMKIILAYFQQIMDLMENALQLDLSHVIHSNAQKNRLYSGISVFALLIILVALKYRWNLINRHKKEISSMFEMISFESIKKSPKLKNKFNEMPLQFHF